MNEQQTVHESLARQFVIEVDRTGSVIVRDSQETKPGTTASGVPTHMPIASSDSLDDAYALVRDQCTEHSDREGTLFYLNPFQPTIKFVAQTAVRFHEAHNRLFTRN